MTYYTVDEAVAYVAGLSRGEVIRVLGARTTTKTLKMICTARLSSHVQPWWELLNLVHERGLVPLPNGVLRRP